MFICPVCGLQISNKSNYSNHKNSHSEVFGYKCNVCSKGFKVNRYLKTHMQKGVRYWQMLCEKENKLYA